MARQASRGPSYPCMTHLMTRGTFYDVGYNVGLSFSRQIKLYFAESDNIRDKLLPFYDSRAGRDYYEASLRVSRDSYPHYVREVRGTADGAGLPFEHVFMGNVSKEVCNVLFDQWKSGEPVDAGSGQPASRCPAREEDALRRFSTGTAAASAQSQRDEDSVVLDDADTSPHPPPPPSATPPPATSPPTTTTTTTTPFQENFGCSDVFLNYPGCQWVVHNEDCDPLIKPYGYLLSAKIQEDGCQTEEFTSFCYPGFLPGCSWGYNVHGLTLSINGLYPDHVVQGSPSRLFVNRSLLGARDVAEVVTLVKNTPHGVAYGFCVNVSTKDGHMVSVEVGPSRDQALVHVHDVTHDVTQRQEPGASRHYYHFNSYKHLTQVSEIQELGSSSRRSQRVLDLAAPRDLCAALKVMADTHDPLGPVFRTPRPTDLGETVCTAAFDVAARQVKIYQGRDDLLGNTPFATLPMYQ